MCFSTVRAEDWTHYAGDQARSGSSDSGPRNLSRQCWVAGEGEDFVWQSSPVVIDNKVIVTGRVRDGQTVTGGFVAAYDRYTTQEIWKQPGLQAFVGMDRELYRLDLDTGQLLWSQPFQLDLPVVNASPLAAEGKVYISDYTGQIFPGPGKLYAINIADGQSAWSQPIGYTIGSTPAYYMGNIYVGNDDGKILCFNADNGTIVWQQDFSGDPIVGGFTGGLAVNNDSVYAASYNFNGGEDNSKLVRLSADNGTVLWTVPCERTRSTPLPAGDRVFLAAGVDGWGSVVKLQCFQDGDNATKLWETTLAGGWTHQPAYSNGRLYAGLIPTSGYSFGPSTDLYVFDAAKAPGEDGFVIDYVTDCGGSVALSDGRLFTLGIDGLYCFRGPRLIADLDGDGTVNWSDFGIFAANWLWQGNPGENDADLNTDGSVDWTDFGIFAGQWLMNEWQ